MNILKNNIAVRCALALCVAMQLLAIMPHHHHDGSAAACIDPTHCIAVDGHECSDDPHAEEAGCGKDCGNCGVPESRCPVASMDITIPGRSQDHGTTLLPVDLMVFPVFTVGSTDDPGGELRAGMLSHISASILSGTKPLHTSYINYIKSAIPARAPSFAV